MKRIHVTLALLAAVAGLAVAGCGGGSGAVPSGMVAVVDGTEIAQSELDALMEQAKNSYEARNQSFPKQGTQEYLSVRQQYVAFLVQKTEFEQAADELGVKITDADVEKTRTDFVKDRFGGDEKKLTAALKEQGLSEKAFLQTLRVSVLSQKIYDAVTKDVKVSDTEALTAFTQNQAQYGGRPESREVRHILIAEKDAKGKVDYAKSKSGADRIYARLKNGEDFAALAKEFSADESSKNTGGKYTANRGQSVPEFDKVAFELKTNEISRPVKTDYGYHVIQAISAIKPPTSFEQLKAAIKSQLLQEKRQQTLTDWVEDLQKRYEDKVTYAAGFAPPEIPEAPTGTETEPETK
jgi:foldase protein PrsA